MDKLSRNEYRRQYRLAHKEQINQYQRDYYKKHYKECPEKYREWNRKSRLMARYEAISHYSGGKMCCECCGENTYEFLCIDHIGGGGKEHRKSLPSAGSITTWLKARGFPLGYRVLCHNCNLALGFYGYCPHQKEVEDEKLEE